MHFILIESSELQKRVLYVLSDTRAKLMELGRRYEPSSSQFYIETINRRKELKELERRLRSGEEKEVMVSNIVYAWDECTIMKERTIQIWFPVFLVGK